MLASIEDVEAYLYGLEIVRTDYSQRLRAVRAALKKLGSPQDSIASVHIAGTSGKGSTAYYTAALLKNMGCTVGLAVSPHVNKISERSQVNGAPLDDDSYCQYFTQFVTVANENNLQLSYLEFLVVFSFWLFAELKLDYIVIEVGLGGRLDPTNTLSLPNTVRVITDIGFDHTEILGNTLSEIAREKAAIIHTGDTVLIHKQTSEVMNVVQKQVVDVSAKLQVVPEDALPYSPLAHFQQRNATLAIATANARLKIDHRPALTRNAIQEALEITIPGRFERFEKDGITVIIDAAHNPQKLSALIEGVKQQHPQKEIVGLVAFGKNKLDALEENLTILHKVATAIIATSFTSDMSDSKSAIDSSIVNRAAAREGFIAEDIENPYEAFERAIELAKQIDAIVLATGSFYLIDGIRTKLL